MKSQIIKSIISSVVFLCIMSCRDDYDTSVPSQELSFSTESIFFDTVFKDIPSSTHILKVFNNENTDILIPSIFLDNGINSYYDIEVDGDLNEEGIYENVLVRKNDYIDIYVTINADEAMQSLYEDKIIFSLGNLTQKVKLTSSVEDVELFRPDDGNKYFEITEDTTWSKTTSKIIYDGLKVKEGAKLSIEKGTKIYFYTNSELIIEGGAELEVNGTKEELVNFRGYRTEPAYDTLIGVWNKISFEENSIGKFNHTYIKGGTTSLELIKANVEINNSQIYNSEQFGLYAENSDLKASNLAINHALRYSVFLNEGGSYDFKQCTIVNYCPFLSNEKNALYVSNVKSKSGDLSYGDLNINVDNSILYSEDRNGLVMFIDNDKATANFNFNTNLINEQSGEINLKGEGFKDIIINEDPMLSEVSSLSTNNLKLTAGSPAINIANKAVANEVPLDIIEVNRMLSPDLGAYEFK